MCRHVNLTNTIMKLTNGRLKSLNTLLKRDMRLARLIWLSKQVEAYICVTNINECSLELSFVQFLISSQAWNISVFYCSCKWSLRFLFFFNKLSSMNLQSLLRKITFNTHKHDVSLHRALVHAHQENDNTCFLGLPNRSNL